MMDWIMKNLGTILVLAVVALICGLIVWKIVRDKKKGKSSTCGCGCGGCAMSEFCHSEKKK